MQTCEAPAERGKAATLGSQIHRWRSRLSSLHDFYRCTALLVFRQAFTCTLPNLMTAKTIPDTHACGKRQGSKINANGPLGTPRENKASRRQSSHSIFC